ncbi:hypothetical protein [Cellulomonas sp.]|uniref:hypothetical protein n=1 Tax=Cellulomonas sp. TaxID=40001 RepID=UPI002587F0D9|nr:hypothetical protein [Cellulomonas sp.]MCR6688714.1 hypothetical protein [Cellulomonas sp.]
MTGRALRRIDAALTAPGPGHRLLEVQTLVALVIGMRLVARDWASIADRPAALVDGLTVVSWLPPHLPAWIPVVLAVVGVGGVGLVVARTHARAGFAVAWGAYVVLCALFALAVAVMHGSIWLFLGIDYLPWVLTAAAVAVPMSLRSDVRLTDALRRRARPTAAPDVTREPAAPALR